MDIKLIRQPNAFNSHALTPGNIKSWITIS